MLARQLRTVVACLIVSIVSVPHVWAQDNTPSILGHAIKATVFDPTTYPAAVLYYDSTMKDWNTSQPFFRNGFVEHNARFTVSGLSNDTAVSYGVGRNQILKDAFAVMGVSALNNFTSSLIEGALKQQYPEHRKAVAVVSWMERIAASSFLSYHVASPHYRQWKRNQELVGQLGLR